MNAAQLSQVLLASWRQRDRSSPWGRWLIAALVIGPSLASIIWLEGGARWGLPTGILIMVLHFGWLALCFNLLLQNDPAAARYVPGHVRALQSAALLGWVTCSLSSTLLMWAVLPPVATWQTLLLCNALAAVFSLWAARWWWLWLGLCVYAPLMGVFEASLKAPLQALQGFWQAHTALLLTAGLLLFGTLVLAAFGHGDARHRRTYEQHRRSQELLRLFQEGRQATPAQTFEALERFSRPFDLLIAAWRRYVVRTADNRSVSSVMARAEVVLHGNQHWTYQLLTATGIAAVVAISLQAVITWTSVPWADLLDHGALGFSFGLVGIALNPILARPMLWQSRREQALLALLPGMPQGAAMNRALAWIGLRHALTAAALVTTLLLPLGAAIGQMSLLWLPLTALPWAIATATRPVARMRPPSAWSTTLPVFGYYLSAGAAYLATARFGLPALPLCAALVVLTVTWGAWRWHQLDRQPTALPAGRLS